MLHEYFCNVSIDTVRLYFLTGIGQDALRLKKSLYWTLKNLRVYILYKEVTRKSFTHVGGNHTNSLQRI